jgi:hypothetical protein
MNTNTPDTLQRIEQARREQVTRLASRAHHFTVTPDTITGGWLVRNPKIAGTVELVHPDGSCSCRMYRLWGRCKHAARVELAK